MSNVHINSRLMYKTMVSNFEYIDDPDNNMFIEHSSHFKIISRNIIYLHYNVFDNILLRVYYYCTYIDNSMINSLFKAD